MRKILLYTLTTLAAAGMASCEDFLTRDTYDQIGSDEFWKSETDLELYANGFIQKMIPGDGTITRGDIYADYCTVSTVHTFVTMPLACASLTHPGLPE